MTMRPFLFDTIYEFIAVICTLHLLLCTVDLVVGQSGQTSQATPIYQNGTCSDFQPYATPRYGQSLQCSAYNGASCCDSGTATRALRWSLENDGCGIIYKECLQLNIDVACHLNCQTEMWTSPDDPTWSGLAARPIVCEDWAVRVWQACASYGWCGTNQLDVSTCTFLEQQTTAHGDETTEVVNSYDTCTIIFNLSPIEFANQILNVDVLPGSNGNGSFMCTNPPTQLYNMATETTLTVMWLSVFLALFTMTFQVLA